MHHWQFKQGILFWFFYKDGNLVDFRSIEEYTYADVITLIHYLNERS